MVAFCNFTKLSPQMFLDWVEVLTQRLRKKDTWYRESLEVGLNVDITLRHLATEDNVPLLCASQHYRHFNWDRLPGHWDWVRR